MKADLVMLHVVALSISLLGGGLIRWHRIQWSRQQQDASLDPREKVFLHSQYRRRMQASSMLLILGVLLNFSNEFLVPWQNFQPLFFAYVGLMLGLVGWMVLLALGDLIATRVVHQAALTRLHEQQRQLEHTVGQMRNFKDQ
ncbi:MAG: hypothetical protein JWM11_4856 [Planctomycetaceae bacterium]|nr:hypothetical protein [Planctomycetaceae bacterium]